MKIFKKLKFKPGFSLMEILAVLFIVSIALLGVLSLIIQNIQVQSVNKNNLIASSLSQEGIELIRQIRDNNWQNSLSFDTGLADGYYRIDYRSIVATPVSNISDYLLFIQNSFYVHNNGVGVGYMPTIFSRHIVITKLSDDVLQVRSIVSWTDHKRPYRYELQTLLYDWR
jgi:prepilin-type N-terminal cleavage/methylation domain-containing protein